MSQPIDSPPAAEKTAASSVLRPPVVASSISPTPEPSTPTSPEGLAEKLTEFIAKHNLSLPHMAGWLVLGALPHQVCIAIRQELVTAFPLAKTPGGKWEMRIYSRDGLAASCALDAASEDGLNLLLAGLALGRINRLPWPTTVLREPY